MYLCVRGIRPVPSQESEQSCIYVLGVLILTVSTIFLLDFGTDLKKTIIKKKNYANHEIS